MMSACAIADTTPTRAHLRLVVLGQWIAAGIALVRGATTTGRGLVGGAVALWRLAQAVRLAILLARRLKQAADAPRAGTTGPAPTPVPAWALDEAPLDDAALRRAMAELDAAIADALGLARPRRLSDRDREPPGSLFLDEVARRDGRASHKARGPSRRPHGRRPLRPPGPARPFRRRWRTPGAQNTAPTPIATLAIGRNPLARGLNARPGARAPRP